MWRRAFDLSYILTDAYADVQANGIDRCIHNLCVYVLYVWMYVQLSLHICLHMYVHMKHPHDTRIVTFLHALTQFSMKHIDTRESEVFICTTRTNSTCLHHLPDIRAVKKPLDS